MFFRSFLYSFILLLFIITPNTAKAGGPTILFSIGETDGINDLDGQNSVLFYVFDLRDRETYIQFTFPDISVNGIAHIQIFDVSNNCNENNFFDTYTPNDTHVYNMRDIQTNDGNPSGVVLPDGSYGIILISSGAFIPIGFDFQAGFGNLRIYDYNGYEYRTNAVQFGNTIGSETIGQNIFSSFNFNSREGVTLSDIIGVTVRREQNGEFPNEWQAVPIQDIFFPFDVDIYDLNEVPFSCRDVVFSCVNDSNPLLEQLLEISGSNVASFEYGINNAIPHSKGGELLCPGNNISEGIVVLIPESRSTETFPSNYFFTAFIGLNNGNGRGSMDSIWTFNYILEGLPPIAD